MNSWSMSQKISHYLQKNKAVLGYLGLAIISLIAVLFLIPLNQRMQGDFLQAQAIAIDQLKHHDAVNWKYDLKHYFLNSGYFLSESILLSKVPANNDDLKREFITHFFRLFDPGYDNEYQGSDLVSFNQFQTLYFNLNTKIQWFTVLASVGIIGLVFLTTWFLINSWKTYCCEQPYYFWTIISIYFGNIVGWLISWLLWHYRDQLKLIKFSFSWWKSGQEPFIVTGKNPDQFLEINQLRFSYGHHANSKWGRWWQKLTKKEIKPVLSGVNLRICQGSFNAILGNNGCGKSTMIRCLLNLETKFRGEIKWNGVNLKKIDPRSLAQNVAYFPQMIDLPSGINVYDFVSFGRTPYQKFGGFLTDHDREIIEKILIHTDTLKFAHLNLDQLSGGQRQKVFIATILAQQTNTIILDEPNTYLDLQNQIWLMEELKKLNQQGKTIILVTHDTNQAAAYADHLIVIDQGIICRAGHPKQVIDQDLLTNVFGINARLKTVKAGRPFITQVQIHE